MSVVQIDKYNKNLIGLQNAASINRFVHLTDVTKGNHLFYEGGGLNYERIMRERAFSQNNSIGPDMKMTGINFLDAGDNAFGLETSSYMNGVNSTLRETPAVEIPEESSWWENNGSSTMGYAADAAADLMSIKTNGLHGWANSESGTDKILNTADPLHWASDGRSNKTGQVLSKTGNSVFMSGAKQGNPYVMLAGAALKIGGGLTNLIGGWKVDEAAQKRLSGLEQRTDQLRTQLAQVGSNEDLYNLNMNFQGANINPAKYKGGLTSRSWRKAKGQLHKDQLREANALGLQESAYNQAVTNVNNNQNRLMFANYAACGGKLNKHADGGQIKGKKSALNSTTIFDDGPKKPDETVMYWAKQAYPNIQESDFAEDGYPNIHPKDIDKTILQFMIDDGTFDKRMGFNADTPVNKKLEAMGRKRIGYGNRNDYTTRLLSAYPELYDTVIANAEQYGMNPNLLFHRLAHEGIYDHYTQNNDNASVADPMDKDVNYFNSFGTFGLDDLMTVKDSLDIRNKKLKDYLDDNVPYYTATTEKGRTVKFVDLDYDFGVSATAAMLDNFRKGIKQAYPDMNDEQLDVATSIAFNRGLEGAKKFIGNDPSKYNFGDYSIYDYVGAVNKHKYGGYTKGSVHELTDKQYNELIKQGFELEII